MKHLLNKTLLLSTVFFASCSDAKNQLDIDTPEQQGTEETVSSKVLVAYFSFTGTTKSIATTLAGVIDGTLYEIVPEETYASDNSNYYDESTRAYKEQYGPATARPAIKKTLENTDSYDIIYLGCPIWYGKAPRLMYTFLDTYKFSGKTVVPFVTSGSSGISTAQGEYESTYKEIKWKKGDRLNGKSADDLKKWVSSR